MTGLYNGNRYVLFQFGIGNNERLKKQMPFLSVHSGKTQIPMWLLPEVSNSGIRMSAKSHQMTRKKLVPKQFIGSKTGATSSVKAPSVGIAKALFNEAQQRLFDINNWQNLCGGKGASFQLTDKHGNALSQTKPEVGNLIKIKLPAPANEKGDGYDWVRIEELENTTNPIYDEETVGFRVRPVSNPADPSDESAHFYTDEATSTFLVVRRASTVYAMERGRNERPNPVGGFWNRIRNIIIALAAMLGLSVPQWKMLVNGIIRQKR